MQKEVLYTFTVPKTIEVEKSINTKDTEGNVVVTKEKVKEVKNHKFVVYKPWRTLREDAQFYNAAQYGKAIQSGAITVLQLEKQYINSGGIYTKNELEDLKDLTSRLSNNLDLQKASSDQVVKDNLDNESQALYSEVLRIQGKSNNIYNNTAEAIARDKTVFFYLVNLMAKDEDGVKKDYLVGETLEDKIDEFDKVETSGSEWDIYVLGLFWAIVGSWYGNKKLTQEDIDKIEITPP